MNTDLKEVSTEFDLEYAEPFLMRVSSLCDSGFAENEISQILSTFKAIQRNQQKQFQFQISVKGEMTKLNIGVIKEDVDIITIYFFTKPEFADIIGKEMVAFFDEHGL